MTLRIAAFILLPMMLLGVLLLRPHALFTMPSVLVDLLIGIVIILPIVALQTWRSRKDDEIAITPVFCGALAPHRLLPVTNLAT